MGAAAAPPETVLLKMARATQMIDGAAFTTFTSRVPKTLPNVSDQKLKGDRI